MKRMMIASLMLVLLSMGQMVQAQKDNYSLETYDKSKMPKYIVLVAEKGGFIFGSEVQVERRRSKLKGQLKWLQRYIRENKASET